MDPVPGMLVYDRLAASDEASAEAAVHRMKREPRQDFEARKTRMRNARHEEAEQFRKSAVRYNVAFERGRRECVALCQIIHAAFPPEVREIIYDHLIKPLMNYHVIEARDEDGNIRTSNNPLVSMSFFDPRSRIPQDPRVRRDIWRYVEYTGENVGKEIAERWYRASTFIVYAEDNLFDKFLSTDVWERNIIPAAVVRNFRLIIGTQYIENRSTYQQVMRNIENLPRISNTKAHITIEVSTGMRYYNDRISTFEDIGPIGYQMMELGYRNLCILDRRYPPDQQDVTQLFRDMTPGVRREDEA
ncbi:hypothetical protein BKA63DRAFT_553760 [Paraphoma chrysanthemicola]|nr:hypothetical protein BKA63DRAFT_553760 [Paraphoma chrysanthemicola]